MLSIRLRYIVLGLFILIDCRSSNGQEKVFQWKNHILTELSLFYPEYQPGGYVERRNVLFYQPLLYYPELQFNLKNRYIKSISVYPQAPFDLASTMLFYPKKVFSFDAYEKVYRVGRLELNSPAIEMRESALSGRIGFEVLYNNAGSQPRNYFNRLFLGGQFSFKKNQVVFEYGVPIRERTRFVYRRIIPRIEISRDMMALRNRTTNLGIGYYGNLYFLRHKKLAIPPDNLDSFILKESVQSIYLKFSF